MKYRKKSEIIEVVKWDGRIVKATDGINGKIDSCRS